MAITVKIDLGYEFNVKAKAAEVFEVLSDVPTSVSHFPKVDQLVDLGGNSYRWEMEKVGTAQVNIQTVYACKYVSQWDAAKGHGTVKWTPVKGVGNALVSGSWDHTVQVWDVATGKPCKKREGHRGPIRCLSVAADGRAMASASSDATVLVWELP